MSDIEGTTLLRLLPLGKGNEEGGGGGGGGAGGTGIFSWMGIGEGGGVSPSLGVVGEEDGRVMVEADPPCEPAPCLCLRRRGRGTDRDLGDVSSSSLDWLAGGFLTGVRRVLLAPPKITPGGGVGRGGW